MSNRDATVLPLRRASRRALFIGGSRHQTAQLHEVARALTGWDARFTPYYADSPLDVAGRLGLVDFSVVGRKRREGCLDYLREHRLPVDLEGRGGHYDLVVTCADACVPRNVRGNRLVLVQEAATDREDWVYDLVRRYPVLPRWLAGAAATGLSHAYDRFCVASEGYRQRLARKGVALDRMVVTGVPGLDDCRRHLASEFPYRGYVLASTTDVRGDRAAFVRECARVAAGRSLIVALDPDEPADRAAREVRRHAPHARVLRDGAAEVMVAHCDALVTRSFSLALVGLALGKEVHAGVDRDELRALLPAQDGCAARNIAAVCREVAGEPAVSPAPRSRWRAGPRIP